MTAKAKALRNYPEGYGPQPCCLTCEHSQKGGGVERAIICRTADVVVGCWCKCDQYAADTSPYASENWTW